MRRGLAATQGIKQQRLIALKSAIIVGKISGFPTKSHYRKAKLILFYESLEQAEQFIPEPVHISTYQDNLYCAMSNIALADGLKVGLVFQARSFREVTREWGSVGAIQGAVIGRTQAYELTAAPKLSALAKKRIIYETLILPHEKGNRMIIGAQS